LSTPEPWSRKARASDHIRCSAVIAMSPRTRSSTAPFSVRTRGGHRRGASVPARGAPACPFREKPGGRRRHVRRQVGHHGLFTRVSSAMPINPSIFKAYDVRGLYPGEINEAAVRDIGRAFVAYLGAKRIAVSRDMRVSSPSLSAAFIEGARAQGADVVDYGLCGTDMLYFVVVRDQLDGGAQITASHNPKEYNGIKMVRREAFPLSGDAGIGDIRDMIASGQLPPPADRSGGLIQKNVVDDYVNHVLGFIDPSIIKPFNVVLDAGNGIAGMVAPKLFAHLPCRVDPLCFDV